MDKWLKYAQEIVKENKRVLGLMKKYGNFSGYEIAQLTKPK